MYTTHWSSGYDVYKAIINRYEQVLNALKLFITMKVKKKHKALSIKIK